jgi:hypothetical protein
VNWRNERITVTTLLASDEIVVTGYLARDGSKFFFIELLHRPVDGSLKLSWWVIAIWKPFSVLWDAKILLVTLYRTFSDCSKNPAEAGFKH